MSISGGVDYFPLSCMLDVKFQLIEAEFGLKGFAIVVKLFQKIYGVQGYYCEWNDEVALLFGRETGLGDEVVSEIVTAAIRRGIFNQEKYDAHGILTSKGIQMRYANIVKRRIDIELIEEYLLVDADSIHKNVCRKRKNVSRNEKNVNINEQSKGKERKVKETKDICASEPCAQAPRESLFEVFWENYPKKRSKQAAEKAFQKLKVDQTLADQINASVTEHKKTHDWQKEKGQFIPYPATFLNGKMWLDEVTIQEEPATSNRKFGLKERAVREYHHDYDTDEIEKIVFGE